MLVNLEVACHIILDLIPGADTYQLSSLQQAILYLCTLVYLWLNYRFMTITKWRILIFLVASAKRFLDYCGIEESPTMGA